MKNKDKLGIMDEFFNKIGILLDKVYIEVCFMVYLKNSGVIVKKGLFFVILIFVKNVLVIG